MRLIARPPSSRRAGPVAGLVGLIIVVLSGVPVEAVERPPSLSNMCEQAARTASRATDVPLDVLRAISITETGRASGGKLQPWPWTVNMEGTGKWFDSMTSALAYVDTHFQSGARSFDIGCFQINYRWHGQAFESITAMFDPETNARYAAGFLSRLYAELGDWSLAAGAYHSRTPAYAERYRARFDRIRAGLSPAPPATPPPATPSPPRENTFPLLVTRTSESALGSLVPLSGRTSDAGLFGQE